MTNITPYGKYLPYHSVYTNIQPFTYRDSRTFIERLEDMWEYIGTIAPAVDEAIAKVVELALTVHGDRTEMERILTLFQNEYAEFLATLDTATDVLEQAIQFRDEVENWLSSLIAVIPKINNALAYTGELSDDKDVLADLQRAVDETPTGGTLFFPRGTYYTTPKGIDIPNQEGYDNWLVIDKPIALVGEPGTVLKNFHVYVKGSVDELKRLDATTEAGGSTFTVPSHGYSVGDTVNLITAFSIYSPDAGEFQNGSTHPRTGVEAHIRGSDIATVASVTANTFTVADPVKFRYTDHNLDHAQPIPGVAGSEVRRIRTIDNVSITGIQFDGLHASSGKIIGARYANNLTIRDCTFTRVGVQGQCVNLAETYNSTVENCGFYHYDDGSANSSSSNMLFVGGGCENISIRGNKFNGGLQCFDATPLLLHLQVPDPSVAKLRATGLSVKNVHLDDNVARTPTTALTFHPGTYDSTIRGNLIEHAQIGILSRVRGVVISENIVHTANVGFSISAFSHNMVLTGNVVKQVQGSGSFTGIQMTSTGVEVTSDNAWKGVVVSNNTIQGEVGAALIFRHDSNVSEPSVADNVMDMVITNNTTNRYFIINADIHGIAITNNVMRGNPGFPLIWIDRRNYEIVIQGNILNNDQQAGIQFGVGSYKRGNVVGQNTYLGTTPNIIPATRIDKSDIHGGDHDTLSGGFLATETAEAPPESPMLVEVPFNTEFLKAPQVFLDASRDITVTVASIKTTSFFVHLTWTGTIRPGFRWLASGPRI